MYNLFVGDNNTELSVLAKQFDPNAKLLDFSVTDYKNLNGTHYTSLADVGNINDFFNICVNASSITYIEPKKWSDSDNNGSSKAKQWTESTLYYCSQNVKVKNLKFDEKKYLKKYSKKQRKNDKNQIWVAGCSFTEGVGVEYSQTWKYHVSKKLGLEYTDLSLCGSSITWSADQILQSDIQKNDIVFWQLTSHNRNYVINENKNDVYHVTAPRLAKLKQKSDLLVEYIDSETTVYKNILAIRQVYNFCRKIKAKLVILGTMYDWDNVYVHYDVPCFEQTIIWPMEYVDLGTDRVHPGPEQHKIYAKKFIELLEKNYD